MRYKKSEDVYMVCVRRARSAAIEVCRFVQRMYENSFGGRVFNTDWCIAMRVFPMAYSWCTRRYGTSQDVYTACGRRTWPAAMEQYRSVHPVYKSSIVCRVFNGRW